MGQLERRLDKSFYNGAFNHDYKHRLDLEVSEMIALKDSNNEVPSVGLRKELIDVISGAYTDSVGEVPDGVQVHRMGNWLLYEDLTNSHPDKVSKEAYPFLTKRQLRTRYNREKADESLQETLSENVYLGGKKQSNYNHSDN